MEWLSGVLSFGLAVGSVPALRWVALRTGAVDRPSGHKAHGRPVPLLGGLAVVGSVAVVVGALQPGELPWLLAASCLALLGLVDDLRGVPAPVRLAVELGVCLGLLWATGTRFWAPPFVPGWAATVLTALWLVGVVNAANCLDCADGSLAGVGLFAAGGLAAVAALVGSPASIPSLAVGGALLGFWAYNRPPASVFLGDAGSLPVGLMIGWLAVRAASEQPAAYTLAGILVLSVPVFDFVAVHARRARRAGWRHVMESVGREHLPHRLLLWSGDSRRGLLALYGLQAGAALAAVAAASFAVPWPGFAALCLWVSVLLWVDTRLPYPAPEDGGPVLAVGARVRPESAG